MSIPQVSDESLCPTSNIKGVQKLKDSKKIQRIITEIKKIIEEIFQLYPYQNLREMKRFFTDPKKQFNLTDFLKAYAELKNKALFQRLFQKLFEKRRELLRLVCLLKSSKLSKQIPSSIQADLNKILRVKTLIELLISFYPQAIILLPINKKLT